MWIELGGDPDAFWRQTPKTYSIFLKGKIAARDDHIKGVQYQSWLTAKLIGFNEVPDFDDIFKTRRGPATASDHAKMEAVAKMIAASGWGVYTPPPDTPETENEGTTSHE